MIKSQIKQKGYNIRSLTSFSFCFIFLRMVKSPIFNNLMLKSGSPNESWAGIQLISYFYDIHIIFVFDEEIFVFYCKKTENIYNIRNKDVYIKQSY